MSLSPREIQELSRLVDEALAQPDAGREAWLAALPAAQQPLVPRLRIALAALARAGQDGTETLELPALRDDAIAPDGRPGQRLGAYVLQQEIGRGGMGSVWRAERADGIFQRQVAIKLPRLARSPRLAERMARERELGARLEHPHIARLYDAGIDEHGGPYLVLEHIDGLPLLEHVRSHRSSRAERLRLLIQMAQAVAHAHRQLVVHRDLKPGNVMVDRQGQVKLLDFGVARDLDETANGSPATPGASNLTRTPAYAAPEQQRGGPISTATDLYALGVVAHELLTGQLPGPGPDGAGVHEALGPELKRVLQRACADDPARRHGSAEAFAQDLQAVLDERPPPSVTVPRWRRMRLFARRHRPVLALGATLGLLLVLAAGLLLGQQRQAQVQQARLDQARQFLLTTLTDTELPGGAVPGAAQLLQATLARARSELGTQPALRAEVMAQIAIVQSRLGVSDGALALLVEAHELLQAHVAADDTGRLGVAALLAAQWAAGADAPRREQAAALADGVLQQCATVTPADRCAKARAWAQAARATLAHWRNEAGAAESALRAALADAAIGFGPAHAEVTALRVGLATLLRNASRLADADAELALAAQAAASQPLKRSDALNLVLLQAVVAHDLGRHTEALRLLDAHDHPPALRVRAAASLALGEFGQALEQADAAAAAATQRQAPFERAMALQLRARVLAARQQHDGALQAWQEADRTVRALGLPERSLPVLRVQRVRVELALHRGDGAGAAGWLGPLLDAAWPPLEQAQALALLGAAHRLQGRWADAVAAHARVDELLRQPLPAGHPSRLRNQFELQLARRQAGGAAAGDSVAQAAAAYVQQLPATSGWRPYVQALAADPAARVQPGP